FALVVAISLWPEPGDDAPAAATSAQQPEGPRAIAVLPFTDLSPNRDSEYMSDGIAEELIYALSKLQNLSVAARTSSFYFKGRNEDVSRIAEQLNVNLVLNGSVRRDGEALRVTAELVNASDGFQLWSERYNRQVDDVFAVQEDITRSIVEALQIELTGAESTRLNQRGTESLEAYTNYLRGRQQWNLRTRAGLENAIELLEQAIEYDPNYARAYAGLADAYIIAAEWGYMPAPVARDHARTATKQALALDPDLPEGYVALAAIEGWYKYDFDYAIAMFEEALELDPRYATGHQWFGLVLAAVGRCEDAADHSERALELDPLSPIIIASQTMPYLCLRDYDEAERLASRALALFPQFDLNRVYLSLAYMGKSDLVSAQKAVTNCELGDCIALNGMINAIRGQTEEAREALRDPAVTERESAEPVFQAWIYIGLGDFDAAFDRLYEAIPQGNSYLMFVRYWPLYDPLRDDPRFDRLLSDLGLDGTP
ncbi:MAG: hypothetical protein KJO98_07415, partial [Rhodothermia bacterium]|nr:hypothetical protein [Rhodothermia bacterium]